MPFCWDLPTESRKGFIVKRTKRIASIRVGESMLGRVIDPLGEPLDGKGLIGGELYENAVGTQSAGSYLPPAGKPTVTDGLESCRRYDSYRTRTA